MANTTELRLALASFLGDMRFRKFVQQGFRRGRLQYWQEQDWIRFSTAHPEFAVELSELAATIRVCHMHGDELQPGVGEVFQGCIDLTQWYIDTRERLFPNAAIDAVSTEGHSFQGDQIDVWFCPSCREARLVWESRKRK